MTTRKSVPDLLHGALERTIADGQWTAAVSIAIELRQWRAAWSRLGLTEAETAVLDETVTATAPDDDRAAQDLKVGDRVRFIKPGMAVRAKVGEVGKIVKIESCLFDVAFDDCAWLCARDQIERVEPEADPLEYGDAVWIKGWLMEEREGARLRYRVKIDDANASFWVPEVTKRSLPELCHKEPGRLKFGQWVTCSGSNDIGIVVEDDGSPENWAPYRVAWRDGRYHEWREGGTLTPIEPQS